MRSGSATIALATITLWFSSAAASPVAMVTDLAGSVSLIESGKARQAALLSYVEPGTAMRVGAGARVVLTFFSRPLEVALAGPAEATVGGEGVTVQKGTAATVRLLQAARADAARNFQSGQRDKVALATIQMRSLTPARIQIQGPADTVVASASPVLAWIGAEGARETRVMILDDQGHPVVDRTVSDTSYALRETLAHGASYSWRVESKLASGQSVSASANFSVADAERAGRIAAARPAPDAPFSERLLFAAQLHADGFAWDAKREWRALAAERPDDPSLRQLAR